MAVATTEQTIDVEKLSQEEREKILLTPHGELSTQMQFIKLQLLEAKYLVDSKKDDFSAVGPKDKVCITVPLRPDGQMFKLNFKTYFGRVTVDLVTAQSLMHEISTAYAVEQDRFIQRGNGDKKGANLFTHDGGNIERFIQYNN